MGKQEDFLYVPVNQIKSLCNTPRKQIILLVSALLLALLLRVGYVLHLNPAEIMTPWSTVKDAHAYNNNALSLIEFGVYGYGGRPSAFHPPLYGLFLAGVYKVFGLNNFLAVRLLQCLLSVSTVFLVYKIAKTIYDEKVGTIVAFVAAIYPFSLYFTGEMLTETLFIFLVNLSLLFLLYVRSKPSALNFFICGALFSLTILSRPVVGFIPLAILWLWVVCEGRRAAVAAKLVLFVVGLQLFIIPWSVRNYRVFNAFMPLPTTGGYTLVLGATMLPYREAQFEVKEMLGYSQWDIKNPDFQEFIDEGKFDKECKALARKLIRENPLGYSLYVAKNFLKFFLNLDFSAIRTRSLGGMLTFASSLLYAVLAICGVVGLLISFRKGILEGPLMLLLFILSSALFYSLFLVGKRYRFATVDYYLIIFSSYFYSLLIERISVLFGRGKIATNEEGGPES